MPTTSRFSADWFLGLLRGLFNIINDHILKAEYKSDAGKINIAVVVLGFAGIFFVGLKVDYWFFGSLACVLFCTMARTEHVDNNGKRRIINT